MGRYHNGSDQHLKFDLGGTVYMVPRGANVSIPSKLDYAVVGMGLRLTPGEVAGAPEAAVEKHEVKQPPLPPGIEMGPIKKRAREENEDLEAGGDGEPLEGDDAEPDVDGEDPVEKTARALEKQGVDVVGRKRHRR